MRTGERGEGAPKSDTGGWGVSECWLGEGLELRNLRMEVLGRLPQISKERKTCPESLTDVRTAGNATKVYIRAERAVNVLKCRGSEW